MVISVATIYKNEVHPAIGTPKLVPTPVIYREVPTANPLTTVRVPKICDICFHLNNFRKFYYKSSYQFQVISKYFHNPVSPFNKVFLSTDHLWLIFLKILD